MSLLGELIFGGKPKSSTVSQSTEEQSGANVSTSFGNQGSESSATSRGESSAAQSVFAGDVFSKLFGGAAATAANIDTSGLTSTAGQLFSGGLNFLQQLQGNPGTAALEARATDNTARDAQLAALKTSLGDFFTENLLPGITSAGVSTGTLGNSRDAVTRSLAAKAVAGQFTQGAASIIGTDQAQKDAAAATLASVTGQNAATGINALGSLYGLQQAGAEAPLTPYQLLATILGNPTVLGTSQSSQISDALSSSFGNQGSQSYGFNYGAGQSSTVSNQVGTRTGGLLTNFLNSLGSSFGTSLGQIGGDFMKGMIGGP